MKSETELKALAFDSFIAIGKIACNNSESGKQIITCCVALTAMYNNQKTIATLHENYGVALQSTVKRVTGYE
ncbi:MAG TPA: hypothetical protein EYN67_06930 [Flavobacteriales bacterium]|nr:hypothetical protein [Flavobacteriales bacterium]